MGDLRLKEAKKLAPIHSVGVKLKIFWVVHSQVQKLKQYTRETADLFIQKVTRPDFSI